MRRAGTTFLRAAVLAIAACGAFGCGGGGGGGGNLPPIVTTSVVGELPFSLGQTATFTVTATDPDGDNVSLRLLNPQPGMSVAPIVDQPSPQTLSVRWLVGGFGVADRAPSLVFAANDDVDPAITVRHVVSARCRGQETDGVVRGDVTGDGVPDTVGLAHLANVGGIVDVGAIYVWDGKASPTGSPAPLAVLTVPGAVLTDELGLAFGAKAVQLEDVTGDGVLDVVATARLANVGGIADTGAIYVWKGGASLVGALSPTATLTVPGAIASDQLGSASGGAVLLEDVTGDGVRDVVATAHLANVGGIADTGAIYVWKGGASLVGALSPTATLTVPGAIASDELGTAAGRAVQLGDVTGDGVLDVVAAARLATVGGIAATGAIYVWKGGASLVGALSPTATLTVPGAVAADALGQSVADAVQLGDVTGDGVLDVVAAAALANVGGIANTGAIYVWKGGASLLGSLSPTATLTVPGAIANEELSFASGQSVQLGDVTGDGVLDVVAAAQLANVGGIAATGAIYVWKGGASLVGALSPTATLTVPGAVASDLLGSASDQAVQLGDVTGDGVLDVVAAASVADVGGIADTGAIYVWKGGASLVGPLSPTATMTVPGAIASDRLDNTFGDGLLLGDVTGDGVLDVVATTFSADVGGIVDAGAIYVWKGGASLAGSLSPTATLTVPGAVASDMLGFTSGQGVQLGDVTGDGVLDVVANSYLATVGGISAAGAIYVWNGGASLAGSLSPTATLTVPGAVASDELGFATGQGVQLGDVTGDGVLDVVAGAEQAKVGAVSSAGAIYVWRGGASLTGSLSPTATLTVPGAVASDDLGDATGQGVQLGDVTGDGVLDVVGAAQVANVGGVSDTGAIYVWKGGASLAGALPPAVKFAVPGAVASDRLGN